MDVNFYNSNTASVYGAKNGLKPGDKVRQINPQSCLPVGVYTVENNQSPSQGYSGGYNSVWFSYKFGIMTKPIADAPPESLKGNKAVFVVEA